MNNYNELINKAMSLVIANQYNPSAQLFDQLNLSQISDYRITKGAGIAYLHTNQHDKAIISFNLSIKANEQQADVHNFIGDLYKKVNQFSLSIKHFTYAIKLEPRVWQFHYNSALCFIVQKNFSSALTALLNAQKLISDNPKIIIALAKTYQNLNDFESAKNILNNTIKTVPNSSVLYFHLGQVYEDLKAFDDAIKAYEKALSIELLPDYYENLALAQLNKGEITKSISTIKTALAKFPHHLSLLKLHSNLAFETGNKTPFSHYEQLLPSSKEPQLIIDYANALILSGNYSQAQEVLTKLQHITGLENEYLLGLCNIYKAQYAYNSITKILESKTTLTSELELIYIEALIAQGNALLAEKRLEPYLINSPLDQYYLALYTCILEQIDKAKYEEFCNYQTLIFTEELQYPKHYGNIENFNEALKNTLEKIHVTTHNPLSQSVVGGKQTPGNLFNKDIPIFQELKTSFLNTFQQAIKRNNTFSLLPTHHPIKRQLSHNIDFSAAWSIWLKPRGFHHSHIHTKGWFSSAYYVDCPKEINDDSSAGYLHLGAPGLFSFNENSVKRWVKPEAGMLAIFPSYFWHGTAPFDSDSPRIIVSADFKPK